jgi:hypothetical protein
VTNVLVEEKLAFARELFLSIAIDEKVLQAAVGMDELDKLKKVEAATKLSQHKGSWKSGDLAHWKSAIEKQKRRK